MTYNPLITVCDTCNRACCWQGEFMCDNCYTAGTTERRVETLIADGTSAFGEHPDYWNRHLDMNHESLLTPMHLRALGVTDPEMLEVSR